MSETAVILSDLREAKDSPNRGVIVSRNALASLTRLVAVAIATLALPTYLTHRLSVERYAAWVLILQLGAYVLYLDFGIQLGVSKFVAEHIARDDSHGAGIKASSGLLLMLLAGFAGLILTSILAWEVPRLFVAMPVSLFREVRVSIILVGFSLSLSLVCSLYSAVFLGLQRYGIPMAISVASRAAFSLAVIAIVAEGGDLVAMSVGVAVVNVATGAAQVLAWRHKAFHVPISFSAIHGAAVRTMASYCFYQSIWTAGMLCVSGLDIAIVGHYDYAQTAYYAIAVLPTSFLSAVLASMLNPIMPASSAMSTSQSASEMGNFLTRITRYSTTILLLTGLSIIVLGFPILRIWIGRDYAFAVLPYLRLLMIANIIRNFCAPYATMICATGRQKTAVIGVIAEAVVNLVCSIVFAHYYGAIGVAVGTLVGSLVSIALYFIVTMRLARHSIDVSRSVFLRQGLLRPLVIVIPSLLLVSRWWRPTALNYQSAFLWSIGTIALAWLVAMNRTDRTSLRDLGRRFFHNQPATG